jgi:hypothetical protein
MEAFAKSRDERKRVEMRFAHLKTHHGFERLRLRGLSGARDEFHLAGAHLMREIAHNWISSVCIKGRTLSESCRGWSLVPVPLA